MDDDRNTVAVSTECGFTLLELMVVISILAILMVATPSFFTAIDDAIKRSERSELFSMLSLARLESVKRGERVVICNSTDQQSCVGDETQDSSDWTHALMFVDSNHNRVIDTDELVLQTMAIASIGHVSWNRGDSLTYEADGTVTGNSNGTFSIWYQDDTDTCSVVIALTGRVRHECS